MFSNGTPAIVHHLCSWWLNLEGLRTPTESLLLCLSRKARGGPGRILTDLAMEEQWKSRSDVEHERRAERDKRYSMNMCKKDHAVTYGG